MTLVAPAVLDVLDPRTGEVIGEIPAGDPETVAAAVRRARSALPDWSRTAPAERGARVKAAARAVRGALDELAQLVHAENGKPLDDARGGVEAGIGTMEQYAELGPLHRGKVLAGNWDATDFMTYEPRGVAAVIVPWNDPIAIACQGIAACLVTGNTVVFKPSEKTPLSAIRLAELIAAELPEGVLELVLGDARAGRPLAEHRDVDVVVFTGSVATGRGIAATCAARGAKAVLELGGKDAFLVDAGVDAEWAAEQAALGAFANSGQICVAAERFYVVQDIAEEFTRALADQARAWQERLGPLIDADLRDRVHEHVREAVAAGARIVQGGELPDGPGFFYPPTVLHGVPDDAELLCDETFGPVAPIRVVGTFDDAIACANESSFGLAAVVLTASQEHAQRAWRELRAGTVKVNAMFGGAPGGAAHPQGLSGEGLGYGPELLDEVTRVKCVHLEAAPPASP